MADEDILNIISKGEQKTRELMDKYKDVGLDDLQKFTIAGTGSVNEWQGEDYSKKRKEMIGFSWIQPAKRERKVNYAIDEYYREQLNRNQKTGKSRSRGPRLFTVSDFQFFPPRYKELQERENYWILKQKGYKVPLKEDGPEEDRKREQEEEQAKVDEAVELTEEEQAEKEELSEQGFEDWNRRDFQAFIRGCERNGRKSMGMVAQEVEGKTLEQVKQYAAVFWERYKEIADHERLINNIERGEAKLKRQTELQEYLSEKVSRYRYPLHQLKINYGPNKVRNWTEEEDRFLLVMLERFGFGSDDTYERIRQEIRTCDEFRFNWFLKSRTSAEIARRCQTLVSYVEKEMMNED
jgi:SWI/SNF-related matrix-associated actin-dependent regulator of chromatin subfamily A member 5